MADANINTKQNKSLLPKGDGTYCRQVCGEVSVTGIRSGASPRFAEVAINDSSWTDVTASFTDPIVVSIQNKSGVQCKVNGDPLTVGYVGMVIEDNEERNYNDLDAGFIVYAKSQAGAATLFVEAIESA